MFLDRYYFVKFLEIFKIVLVVRNKEFKIRKIMRGFVCLNCNILFLVYKDLRLFYGKEYI